VTDQHVPDPAQDRADQELLDRLRALLNEPVPTDVLEAAKALFPADP